MTEAHKRKASFREASGRNVVAYVGYDSGLHSPSSATRSRSRLAWGRLAAVAVSALSWIGIIAAIRAIF
jgi:hypothetical protein